MSEQKFVHLHLHTQYSLLQGAIRVKNLMKRVTELGMPAVAMTDTNNLFGAIDFYQTAKSQGVKPILGCEILFCPDGQFLAQAQSQGQTIRSQDFKPLFHHLVLLCKNHQGYLNLCQIITQAYKEAPQVKKGTTQAPRALVDRKLLEKFGGDLIVLSGCLRGELAYKILTGKEREAEESVAWFKEKFGEDFYLELVDSQIPEQDQVNDTLYQFGKRMGIQCVATSDCHYLNPEEASAQEVLQCIENGRNLDVDRPKSLVPSQFYLKPAELMYEHFARFPEVCENTVKIADRCNLEFKFNDEKGNKIYHLPNFRPNGVMAEDHFDLVGYFRDQSRQGLAERFEEPSFLEKRQTPEWAELEKSYHARLEDELSMIERTGFASYFLIVADFINWAKRHGIPVGPGRGSGAGSLVAYVLKITDIDPIEFKLLFERFINPERVSLPDFDVDFCQDRRGEVIEYVENKYGKSNVCQIITFGKLQARAVLKDVGRVLGLTFAETDELTKLLPEELNIKLKDALEKEPRLRDKIASDSKLAMVFDYALKLEGLYRNAGIHAAGVIITEKPVVNYCPLYVSADGDVVTQFDKDFAEAVGLVKFDFLGLKTLTVIDNAIKLVKRTAEPGSPEAEFELARINYRDQNVFDLISSGDTDGVFQVESSGMKDLCSRLKPSSVEDLTAINALYRPGPLGSGMVDDFIDRKHGRQAMAYELDILEPILRETYGVILYQEQVMQIARELAGYSLGQADMLRRAMGKKKADEMQKHKEIFVQGASARGIPSNKAESIFDLMAKFAEYGFNKSHSAAYAVLTYQTAFLKTYYPAEFMAALMTTEINNTDKITKYLTDARAHQIAILPPDVNQSEKQFSVQMKDGKKAIRFGLEGIKGVGGIAVDSILDARMGKVPEGTLADLTVPSGPFKDIFDFCKRVSTRKVNKKVLESLTLAGAFDPIITNLNRATLFESLEALLKFAADEQEERALGQATLFDSIQSDEVKLFTPADKIFNTQKDWPNSKKLSMEKQVVGFYVSGHPMDGWQKICEDWLGWNTVKLKQYAENMAARKAQQPAAVEYGGQGGYRRPARKEVLIAGLISDLREIMTKKGTRMAFGQIEDIYGKVEVIFFPNAFTELESKVKQAVVETEPMILTGEIEVEEENIKIFAQKLEPAKLAYEQKSKRAASQMILRLDPSKVSVEQLRELKTHLLQHRGRCPVTIEFEESGFKTALKLPRSALVSDSPQLVSTIERIFGPNVVSLR